MLGFHYGIAPGSATSSACEVSEKCFAANVNEWSSQEDGIYATGDSDASWYSGAPVYASSDALQPPANYSTQFAAPTKHYSPLSHPSCPSSASHYPVSAYSYQTTVGSPSEASSVISSPSPSTPDLNWEFYYPSSGASYPTSLPLEQTYSPTTFAAAFPASHQDSGSPHANYNTSQASQVSYACLSQQQTLPLQSPLNQQAPSQPQCYSSLGATKSQLIKEGLKVSIQNRLRLEATPSSGLRDEATMEDESRDTFFEDGTQSSDGRASSALSGPFDFKPRSTPEDEERRRRRRERNKVAATKCRHKKKAHVFKLGIESESLESGNCAMRRELLELEKERVRLTSLLRAHRPFCEKNANWTPP